MKDAIVGLMVRNQDAYRADAVARMERLTDRQRAARPTAGLHSPLWLLVHLAEVERHYLEVLAGRRSEKPRLTLPPDRPEPDPWPAWPDLLNFVRQTRRRWIEHLQGMDEASLARSYGQKPHHSGAGIVAHVFEHESFHMGQLRWALRMAGSA